MKNSLPGAAILGLSGIVATASSVADRERTAFARIEPVRHAQSKPLTVRRLERLALAGIIAAAIALGSYWAIAVPIFAQPDEMAHADYVFALTDAGRPFLLERTSPAIAVTPQVRYLASAVHYRENRYSSVARLPHGYGSTAYYHELDRGAPDESSLTSGSPFPYVAFQYPIGYYAIAAIAMRTARTFAPEAFAAQFFAARAIGVLTFGATLVFAFGIFRSIRMRPLAALLATAGVAFFPLATWVDSYVQPDSLATTLVAAALFASLRWRNEPRSRWAPLMLSLALASLAFVKQHFELATFVSVALAAVANPQTRRRLPSMVLTFGFPLLASIAAAHWTPIGPLRTAQLLALGHDNMTQGTPASYAALALKSAYGGGDTFDDFWLLFGLQPAHIFPAGVEYAMRRALELATIACLMIFVIRTRFVVGRILIVARHRSAAIAAHLLVGDALVNVYLIVTAILISVYTLSYGRVWLEGRYWLPVLVPLVAIVTARMPRFLPAPIRRRATLALAGVWCTYGLVAAPFAVAAIARTYYDSDGSAPSRERFAQITKAEPWRCSAAPDTSALTVRPGCPISVQGYAVDSSRGLPARTVYITLDGAIVGRARTGLPSVDIRNAYTDESLSACRFSARLETRSIAAGSHVLGLAIVEAEAPHVRPATAGIPFEVR